MQITFVTDKWERNEYKSAIEKYSLYSDGKISQGEWEQVPQKEWIDLIDRPDGKSKFLVVDNRDGNCWVEEFDTLDGAMLYANDVYMTCENRSDWDYMGALKDGGDIIESVPQ